MFVECWAIVAIVLAIAFIFLRTGRKDYFLNMIPLTFVPFMHLVGFLLVVPITGTFDISRQQTHTVIDIIGLIVACICFGIFSHAFKNRKAKMIYLFISGGFTLILTWVLMLTMRV